MLSIFWPFIQCPIIARLSVRELEEATEEIGKEIKKDLEIGNQSGKNEKTNEKLKKINIELDIQKCQKNLGNILNQMEMVRFYNLFFLYYSVF